MLKNVENLKNLENPRTHFCRISFQTQRPPKNNKHCPCVCLPACLHLCSCVCSPRPAFNVNARLGKQTHEQTTRQTDAQTNKYTGQSASLFPPFIVSEGISGTKHGYPVSVFQSLRALCLVRLIVAILIVIHCNCSSVCFLPCMPLQVRAVVGFS